MDLRGKTVTLAHGAGGKQTAELNRKSEKHLEFYSIASGSSGNCIYIGSDKASVLIDAGVSFKRISEALGGIGHSVHDLTAVLVTHEHSDHIAGLGVLLRKAHIPVYATSATIRQILRYSPLGKVDESLFHPVDADCPFEIGDLKAEAFHISHDAADPVAYRVEEGKRAAAVATDMGSFNRYTLNHLRKGHLSNLSSAMLLSQVLNDHMKMAYLGHLSKTNNYADLAYATVISEMAMDPECHYSEGDIPIRVASREHPMELLRL